MELSVTQYDDIVNKAAQRVRAQGVDGADKFDQLIIVAAMGQSRILKQLDDAHAALDAVTAATQHDIAIRLDTGNRFSGGTTVAVTNANMDIGNMSVGRVIANPTIVAATNNVRHFGHYVAKKAAAPAYIVDDVVILKFGGLEAASISNIIATTTGITVIPCPPVAIGPNQSLCINEWAAARTAALSGEIFIGWIER